MPVSCPTSMMSVLTTYASNLTLIRPANWNDGITSASCESILCDVAIERAKLWLHLPKANEVRLGCRKSGTAVPVDLARHDRDILRAAAVEGHRLLGESR